MNKVDVCLKTLPGHTERSLQQSHNEREWRQYHIDGQDWCCTARTFSTGAPLESLETPRNWTGKFEINLLLLYIHEAYPAISYWSPSTWPYVIYMVVEVMSARAYCVRVAFLNRSITGRWSRAERWGAAPASRCCWAPCCCCCETIIPGDTSTCCRWTGSTSWTTCSWPSRYFHLILITT